MNGSYDCITEDPFVAAEKDAHDLFILADVVVNANNNVTNDNNNNESIICAFQLDGKPCRLCGEGEEDVAEEKADKDEQDSSSPKEKGVLKGNSRGD